MFPRLQGAAQQSRLAIVGRRAADALHCAHYFRRPSVLLLDEPLEGLAPVICEELMAALTRLASSGEMTILLVEQRLESGSRFRGRRY